MKVNIYGIINPITKEIVYIGQTPSKYKSIDEKIAIGKKISKNLKVKRNLLDLLII